jgi:hypothetical protein
MRNSDICPDKLMRSKFLGSEMLFEMQSGYYPGSFCLMLTVKRIVSETADGKAAARLILHAQAYVPNA